MSRNMLVGTACLFVLLLFLAIYFSGGGNKKEAYGSDPNPVFTELPVDNGVAISDKKPLQANKEMMQLGRQEKPLAEKNRKSKNTQRGEDEQASHMDARYRELSDNSAYPDLNSRMDALDKMRPHDKLTSDEVVSALAKKEAWSPMTQAAEHLPLNENEKIDGREFIRFDNTRVKVLLPGDILEIPVEQLNETFSMRVQRYQNNSNGSTTWYGVLQYYPEKYHVVVTVGERLSMAGIQTPHGSFDLQANDDVGWIVSGATASSKQNYDEPDYIIPNINDSES